MADLFPCLKKLIDANAVFRKNSISPIGFNYRQFTVTEFALNPNAPFPNAVRRSLPQLENGFGTSIVLTRISIKASFTGNAVGNNFFLGVMRSPSAVENISNNANVITSLVNNQTTNLILSAEQNFNPYSGYALNAGQRLGVVLAGDGGGDVLYSVTFYYLDSKASILLP